MDDGVKKPDSRKSQNLLEARGNNPGHHGAKNQLDASTTPSGKAPDRPGFIPEHPHRTNKERIDLPIREIRQLFESFKGIRISNRMAYQIQESLIQGEGEQVGPSLDVGGIKVRFAINGLPSLTALRRAMLYRCLTKSRQKDGRIDLEYTARFIGLDPKGSLDPVQLLKRRLLHVGISLSPDRKDIRVSGGLSFERVSFDFDAPAEGLDISDFGRKLLLALYEYHDCSVSATAQFFHTSDQLIWGMLKRAGIEFDTPEALKHFQLPPELDRLFGPAIQKQLRSRLSIPMTEILRTAKARAGKKKLANRRFLDEMEEHIRNFIYLVLVPEFGSSVLTEDNAAALHATAWHFLQWEIGQLPVEDIINLSVVSPYEMMLSRVLRRLGVTKNGSPVFYNKDYVHQLMKPYAPMVVTLENLQLIFRIFKTADLIESSLHVSHTVDPDQERDPEQAELEIEVRNLQKQPLELDRTEILERLGRVAQAAQNTTEYHGVLSVEIKQVLAALQDIVELPVVHFFGFPKEETDKVKAMIHETIAEIQSFIKDARTIAQSEETIKTAYLRCLDAHERLCISYRESAVRDRAAVSTWAALHELYRILFTVKGLDPPHSRKKKKIGLGLKPAPAEHELPYPMLYFGPHLHEIPNDMLLRATFVFPSDTFKKLNLIPPHLRSFFVIDEPNNHLGQYHLAAWAFRIHWKRRRLGQGQKTIADSYIRSLRFLRCFAYKRDRSAQPYLIFCNVDSEISGLARWAGGETLIEHSRKVAQQAFQITPKQIIEITEAEEPADEHEKLEYFLDRMTSKTPRRF